jgi:hypothetical protein
MCGRFHFINWRFAMKHYPITGIRIVPHADGVLAWYGYGCGEPGSFASQDDFEASFRTWLQQRRVNLAAQLTELDMIERGLRYPAEA